MSSGDKIVRAQGGDVVSLATGAAITLDARFCRNLTIISGTGATVTYSRVDSAAATAHKSGTENGGTVAATTKLVIAVDWPFWRIDTASGPARIGLV